ncbi:hypothetical protein FA95DRAFT_1570394 [Auriscalpium vulgare]|uniref:Uncharacterized protein n=1 Tax=Auriscalpium vulgare TaxID=40419 RepID=A0ACB8S470_9AGAM|nr:hypothetical protein FA95DRAFT_1570394 [Auriscalpium vulgare]
MSETHIGSPSLGITEKHRTLLNESLNALEIRTALENVNRLPAIGHCPTKVRLTREKNSHWFLDDYHRSYVDSDVLRNEDDEKPVTANEVYVSRLSRLYRRAPVFSSGHLDSPFPLSIKRSGCEETKIIKTRDTPNQADDDEESWLRKLFDNAAVSGFGDMRTQETKVDASVRDAREIPATEFNVASELLAEVRSLWAARLYPREVRVTPYKIHLYGPGGRFKSHRDTPEKGLVGTFLLGIGDTSWMPRFELNVPETALRQTKLWSSDQEREAHADADSDEQGETQLKGTPSTSFHARPGDWVAFYPDVNHRVTELSGSDYRGVIAFKIFHDDVPANSTPSIDPVVVNHVKSIANKLQPPFGLLLGRKYCLGTTKLSGFDAVMYEALAQRAGVVTYLLPVVIKHSAHVQQNDDFEPIQRGFTTHVHPFTEAHVRALADGVREGFKADWPYRREVPLEKDLLWLKRLNESVEFMAVDFQGSTVQWSHTEAEDDTLGNEARAYSEDSTYLSYALVVLSEEDRPISSGNM